MHEKRARVSASPEPFVGTAAAAEFLGKPASWVYDNADRLGIPRVRLGNQYRYRLSRVAAWAEAQTAAAEGGDGPAPLSAVSEQ
jgi:predicted DNA-binding transcriptional regulator AlpA